MTAVVLPSLGGCPGVVGWSLVGGVCPGGGGPDSDIGDSGSVPGGGTTGVLCPGDDVNVDTAGGGGGGGGGGTMPEFVGMASDSGQTVVTIVVPSTMVVITVSLSRLLLVLLSGQ